MPNYLDEYLVRLGFSTDTTAFAQFSSAIRDASGIVDTQYGAMAKKILGFQATVTGVFAAIGGAVVENALSVASADQEYRLLALHMYTSLPVARELKIALDALGQPLENVLWDPELSARFHQLIKDQQTLTQELGPDFENQMLRIRDVRFEFDRFGVTLKYLTMDVVKDLAGAFGMTTDQLLGKLKSFNDYFILHMPEIAEWIATRLKPVLEDVWNVMVDTGEAVEAGVVAFDNLIGVLSGDTSIQGTAFSFDKTATAIQYCIDNLALFISEITKGEIGLSHLLIAAADLKAGDWEGARKELGAANNSSQSPGHFPLEPVPGGFLDHLSQRLGITAPPDYRPGDEADTQALVIRMARQLGVPPELALAVAQQESGFKQYDAAGNVVTSPSGALGIMQLMPKTAKRLGVDPNDPTGNVLGGETYLRQLLDQYHWNKEQVLEHYHGIGKDPLGMSGADYARQVLGKESAITIQGVYVTIHAKTDATPKQIGDAVSTALGKIVIDQKNKIQRNIGEPDAESWSYGQ